MLCDSFDNMTQESDGGSGPGKGSSSSDDEDGKSSDKDSSFINIKIDGNLKDDVNAVEDNLKKGATS